MNPNEMHVTDHGEARNLQNEILSLVSLPMPFTNIHIEEDMPVMVDSPQRWIEIDPFDQMPPVSRAEMIPLLDKIDPEWEEKCKTQLISRPYELSAWRLRVSACIASGKMVIAVRRQPKTPMSITRLGLPMIVQTMAEAPRGLVLVVGATGSGKTTTIASMLDHINETRNVHIATIEDPVEYVHSRKKSLFTQREVGEGLGSYRQGVKDAMRLSPNVIMIGEIRDAETADIAMQAADSGHLVLASMHANGAASAVTKILSYFPETENKSRSVSLSESLVGIIFQALLPRMPSRGNDMQKVGDFTDGYVLASEIAFNDQHQLAESIAANDSKSFNEFLENKSDRKSRSFGKHLAELVSQKILDKADAMQAITFGRTSLFEMIKSLP